VAAYKRILYTEAAANDSADVQVFQGLPLPIRSKVLKEGKIILVKDEPALYELAFDTVNEFEDFKKHYEDCLAGTLNAESG